MEKLKKLGIKNIYLALAATSLWFACVWIYSKAIKPLLIRREVTKLIERLEQESAQSNK